MSKGIKQYYREMVNKPSEFHRVKELFNHTLLNLTLWMAISAFAFSILIDSNLENIRWFFGVIRMSMTEDALMVIRWLLVFMFGGISLISFLAVCYLIVSWIVVNFVRRRKHSEDREDKKQSTVGTKVDIHIETTEPIEESLKKLLAKLEGDKEE